MKIIVNRERLIKEINNVSKAVPSKTTLQILTGIRLEATREGLSLLGSDADTSIQTLIPAEEGTEVIKIVETGGIVLNAKTLSSTIKAMSSIDVEISVNAEELIAKLKSNKAIYKLNGQDIEDYPRLQNFKEENSTTVKTSSLKKVINNTSFAVSVSETRPILTGMNWRLTDNKLICVATDSHRLAKQTIEVETNSTEDIEVTIPGKYLAALSKILDDAVSETQIFFKDNQAMFKSGNTIMYARLLEGTYPATDRLIPTTSNTDVTFCSKMLAQAIDRATILDKKTSTVKLEINSEGVTLSSNIPEIGKVTEELFSESIEGEDLTISFNASFLLDLLKTFEGKIAKCCFGGQMRPFTIAPVGDDSMVHLVLPIRTY